MCLQVNYTRRMDLLSRFGFLLLLNFDPWQMIRKCVLWLEARHLVPTGMAWYGVPCSSWIFMSLWLTSELLLSF